MYGAAAHIKHDIIPIVLVLVYHFLSHSYFSYSLEEKELLFTEDVFKDVIIDFKKRKTVVKALCLHIAHDCNLACKILYQKVNRLLANFQTHKFPFLTMIFSLICETILAGKVTIMCNM